MSDFEIGDLGHVEEHNVLTAGAFNVKRYGALGDSVTDDTAAIQSAITAAGAARGTVIIPPGTYRVTSTLTLPPAAMSVVGLGRPSGRPSVSATSSAVLVFSGTGACIARNVGVASISFTPFTLANLRIEADGNTDQVGVQIGRVCNWTIDTVSVCGFTSGTAFQIGEVGTGDAQYGTMRDIHVGECMYGVRVIEQNGLRIIGGLLEGSAEDTVGSVGILHTGGDTLSAVGLVVQEFDTLIQTNGANCSFLGVRCEVFTTAAYHITRPDAGGKSFWSITGGSINNNLGGGVGTGVIVDAGHNYGMFTAPRPQQVATDFADSGTGNLFTTPTA